MIKLLYGCHFNFKILKFFSFRPKPLCENFNVVFLSIFTRKHLCGGVPRWIAGDERIAAWETSGEN